MAAKSGSTTQATQKKGKEEVQPLPKGIWLEADGLHHWQVKRKRPDGSVFRKAGKCKALQDAIEKFNAAKAEFENGEIAKTQVPSFGEWADYVVKNVMPEGPSRSGRPLSPRTIDSYVHLINKWLKPNLGSIHLDMLTPEHVETLLGKVGGEAQSRLNVRNLGSKLYVLAQVRGKVPQGFNPFKLITVSKAKRKRGENGEVVSDMRILTDEEEEKLLSTAKDSEHYEWFYGALLIGLRCGLRISEVAGLDWRAVDLDRGILRVTQQSVNVTKATRELIRHKSKQSKIVTDPKTESGIRTIPLPMSVREWLIAHKAVVGQQQWVFANGHGKDRIDRSRLNTAMNKTVTRSNLRTHDEHGTQLAVPTFHDLRHTWCTRLANRHKVSPNVLKSLAGHSNIVTTLGYYVHADDADLAEAMAKIP